MEATMYRIFIVEDDTAICNIVSDLLSKWGYLTHIVTNFENVLEDFANFKPQLVLMDINLPNYDGFFFANKIRSFSKIPIVFLSSRSNNMDIIMAMNMGGDDFITKPFSSDVLLAKISAILRRTYDYGQQNTELIEHNGLLLNISDYTVYVDNKKEILTKNEFRIIYLLLKHKGEIISRDEIMRVLWEDESFVDDNTLTVNINRLRKKLLVLGLSDYILTKKGEGYYIP